MKCFKKDIIVPEYIIDYIKSFSSDEEFLRSGGLSVDMLDELAFGFKTSDVKTLIPNELKIEWVDDLENVLYEIENTLWWIKDGKKEEPTKENWAKHVDLSEPIDVYYKEHNNIRGFFIQDGHHRYYAAKILNKKLNVNLEIKINPTREITNLSYDDLHRCLFKSINKHINNKYIKTFNEHRVFEYYQQANKLYFKDSKLDKEIEMFITNLTHKDVYTKLVSDLIYHFNKFSNGKFNDSYKRMLTEFYHNLKNYDKNILPIPGKEISKYGIEKEGRFHILDLYGILENREKAIKLLKELPKIALRNFRKEIRIERGEYDYKSLITNLNSIVKSLDSIKDNIKYKEIINKSFNSKNDIETTSLYLDKFAMSFNLRNEMIDKDGYYLSNRKRVDRC